MAEGEYVTIHFEHLPVEARFNMTVQDGKWWAADENGWIVMEWQAYIDSIEEHYPGAVERRKPCPTCGR